MAIYRTLALFVFVAITVVAAQRRFVQTTTTRTNDNANYCRGQFDCKEPFECSDETRRCVIARKFCRWPGKPNFAILRPDQREYELGDEILFSCETFYKLTGQKKIRCNDDGKWSHANPKCVATRCTNPGRPSRGLLTPDKPYYSLGETVRIACKSFFKPQGSTQTRCLEDGTWSNDLPDCIKEF